MLETMALGTPVKSLGTLDSSTISQSDSQILKSPDLFESEESDDGECFTEETSSKPENTGFKLEVDVRDEKYLKTLKTTLAGIPPPPKFTIPQFSAAEMVEMYNKNVEEHLGFLKDVDKTEDKAINDEMKQLQFPESMKCLYYGIHYNRGPMSVEFESLSDKYRARYVGCETSSTVIDKAKTNSATDHLTGSAKKKARRHPWNYSPGRRLSHLARRRQIFTSASMAKSALGNRALGKVNGVMDSKRMILLDKKKSSQPSTSATSACRARLSSITLAASSRTSSTTLAASSRTSSVYSAMPTLEPNVPLPTSASHSQMPSLKRALFQSPDCFSKESSSSAHLTSNDCKETPRTDKNKARRALFSSGTKKTPNKKTPNKKTPRKGGGGLRRTPHKGTPTSSRKKTPRKSLFADPDTRSGLSSRDLFNVNGKRPRSESLLNLHQQSSTDTSVQLVTLSNDEKKKLLWVVYHCLKERKINTKNSLYKPCQNYLYRLCSDEWKTQLREHPVGGKVSNVSERMLNIARKLVSGVILKVKNNQTFYRSSSSAKLDNSSESGDTSASHSASNPADRRLQDQLSTCDEKSDLESFAAKSDFDRESITLRSDVESVCAHSDIDRESICARSDMESTCEKSEYSYRLVGGESSNSCLQDEDTNTTGSVGPNIDQLEPIGAGRLETNGQSCRLGTLGQSNTIVSVGNENMDQSDSMGSSMLEMNQSNTTSSFSTNNTSSSLHSKRNSNAESKSFSEETTTSSVSVDTVSSTSSSVQLPPDVFSLTNSSFLRETKSCKVELGVRYEKRALNDITSMYDEETRF